MSLSAKPSLLVIQNAIRIISRSLSVSTPRSYREVTIKEDGNKITIEGIPKESDRKDRIVEPEFLRSTSSDSCDAKENCHPLCRFSQVHEIKHTDVLILEQFVESNGKTRPTQTLLQGIIVLCHTFPGVHPWFFFRVWDNMSYSCTVTKTKCPSEGKRMCIIATCR